MDLQLVSSFIALAEEASFSTAAKHLFITQQSLSKQIAKLEEELGTTLIVRSRPLRLTSDGRIFLQTAKEMVKLKLQLDENLGSRKSGKSVIHVGIEHTLARATLPVVLPAFFASHPDCYVKISEESPDELEKASAYEGVDFIIGSITNLPIDCTVIPLCRKEMLLVVPKKIMHNLCGDSYEEVCRRFSESADLRFFEKAPFIKQPGDSSGGRALKSYIKYYDIRPSYICELTNVENAFQLANSGIGVFIYAKMFWDAIPDSAKEDYLKNVDVFPLPYLPDTDNVCAYYDRDVELSTNTKDLLSLFSNFFTSMEAG